MIDCFRGHCECSVKSGSQEEKSYKETCPGLIMVTQQTVVEVGGWKLLREVE